MDDIQPVVEAVVERPLLDSVDQGNWGRRDDAAPDAPRLTWTGSDCRQTLGQPQLNTPGQAADITKKDCPRLRQCRPRTLDRLSILDVEQLEQAGFEGVCGLTTVHRHKWPLPPTAQDVNAAGEHFGGFLVAGEKHARI
jgi:hypothetical protein